MLPDPQYFLDQIFFALTSAGIQVHEYQLDHICYRVATTTRYEKLKEFLLLNNELLSETIINQRPIATFRMQQPFVYQERKIALLELPSPKPGSPYQEGYEHAEFAIRTPPNQWIQQYPSINWETKDLRKSVNPDVRLRVTDNISVKFHEHPLDYVIKYLD